MTNLYCIGCGSSIIVSHRSCRMCGCRRFSSKLTTPSFDRMDVRATAVVNYLKYAPEQVDYLAVAVKLQIPKAEVEEIARRYERHWRVV